MEPIRPSILIILVILGSLIYLCGLAVGPRVSQQSIDQDHLWLENIQFSSYFGVSLNCDSYFYMIGAADTRTVFAHNSVIQSRPLLPLIAHPLSKLLEVVVFRPLPRASKLFNKLLHTYIAYILINLLVLIWAYWLYFKIVVHPNNINSAPTSLVIGTFLIANDITKAFFFSPHTQMLNLLLPLLALYALLKLRITNISRQTYVYYALLSGLGVLVYGSSIVVGAAILLARLYRYISTKDTSAIIALFELLILSAILIAPNIIWWGIVTLTTGEFYSSEVSRWNQIVWMLDVFDKGWLWLASSLISNLKFFILSALLHMIPIVPVILLLTWFSWPYHSLLKEVLKNNIFVCSTVIAIIFLIFFSMVGYCVGRLAIPPAVMGIVIIGLWTSHLETKLNEVGRQQLLYSTGILIMLQSTWMVVKYGPNY
ncbi:membrane hypothetical protein [Desulfosarcina cetonica]|uniref:hypothetical protein n=1 Tax=Desulfosarcina cetonica TaxID=90730 RepID=UPI0012EE8DEF|nr:hypothetical protein [Desulfosarcina cetonica]VTR64736.1 membrane hypothetical protein [Desulfosarcina cetonica]